MFDADIYTWSVLITAIFFTSFGLFAYIRNPKEPSAKLFALLSLAFAVWSYSWFFLLKASNPIDALFFAKLLNFGATFIPVFYLHWSLIVVELQKKRKILIIAAYVITAIFGGLSFTDFYIPGVRPILFFPYWPIAGIAYTAFIIFGYIGLVSYSVFELVKGYKHSTGDKKSQIGYLLAGSMLGFGGGATNFPLMYGLTFMQPVGLFAVMLGPFFFSYAAVRYRLMNIKIVATQFFLGALNIVFIINVILSTSLNERFFNLLLLVFVFYFSVLVYRSVRREILQREKIQLLAEDLEKANTRLTELDKQKSEFVSFASHQLRAPLTAMKGYGSLLLEGDMGVLTPDSRDGIQHIYDSTSTLVHIVDDYLNVSRIELGTMKYAFETVDFKTLIQDVIAELKPTIDTSGLDFTFRAENDEADYRITADRDKLKQVIANLVDNSMKYTPKGAVAVTLSYDRPRHKFIFKLKDDGIGIDPQVLPHLFQKFSRAQNANKTNIKGTGLGLFVAKQIVEAHQGTIRAESEGEGKGSTFVVELEPLTRV